MEDPVSKIEADVLPGSGGTAVNAADVQDAQTQEGETRASGDVAGDNSVTSLTDEDAAPIRGFHISRINGVCVGISIILVALAIIISANLIDAIGKSDAIHERYEECSHAATELMIASDNLTNQSRMFVVTGDRQYLDAYLDELLVTKNRDNAVAVLNRDSTDASAAGELTQALSESNDLAIDELYAMRLTCDAVGIDPLPESLATISIEPEDDALTPEAKEKRAEEMLLGDSYSKKKSLIENDVNDCANELVQGLQEKELAIEKKINRLIIMLVLIVVLMMALGIFAAITNYLLLMRPMRIHEENVKHDKPLEDIGAFEIRRVVRPYNKMHKIIQDRTGHLKHEAETDALTGMFNRGSYDRFLKECEGDYALVLADIDRFKQVNDTYGHAVGDEVLKKVASVIQPQFRTSDKVCRIGGDEFAILMPGAKSTASARSIISQKLEEIAENLEDIEDDLPHVSLSFGVAFKDSLQYGDNIYHAADKALYRAKHKGRNCYAFSGDDE